MRTRLHARGLRTLGRRVGRRRRQNQNSRKTLAASSPLTGRDSWRDRVGHRPDGRRRRKRLGQVSGGVLATAPCSKLATRSAVELLFSTARVVDPGARDRRGPNHGGQSCKASGKWSQQHLERPSASKARFAAVQGEGLILPPDGVRGRQAKASVR